jgi:hypothetical protein
MMLTVNGWVSIKVHYNDYDKGYHFSNNELRSRRRGHDILYKPYPSVNHFHCRHRQTSGSWVSSKGYVDRTVNRLCSRCHQLKPASQFSHRNYYTCRKCVVQYLSERKKTKP